MVSASAQPVVTAAPTAGKVIGATLAIIGVNLGNVNYGVNCG